MPHAAKTAATAFGCLLAAWTLTACTQNPDGDEAVMVMGASSTRVINDELSALAPAPLRFTNAGSTTLIQQLADGAPGDIVLTASRATMESAVAAGIVEKPVAIASNRMIMVVPAANPAGITSVDDITDTTRVALCDPQVPCGKIAQQIIADNGWDITADTYELQVSDALSRVVTGEADVGWVYSTDAAAAGDKVKAIDIPGAGRHANEIMGAVATAAPHKQAAQATLDLLANDFDTQWEKYGFSPAS